MSLLFLAVAVHALPAQSAALHQLPAFTAQVELTVGHQLTHLDGPASIAIRSDGSVIVSPAAQDNAMLVSSDGKRVGSFAGSTDDPFILAGITGDSIWGRDRNWRRITLVYPGRVVAKVFDNPVEYTMPNGDVLASLGMAGMGRPFMSIAAGGNLIVRPALPLAQSFFPDLPVRAVPILQVSLTGVVRHLIGSVGPPDTACEKRSAINCEMPVVRAGGNGRWIVTLRPAVSGPDSGTFAVTLVSTGGDTAYTRHLPFTVQTFAAGEADSLIKTRIRNPPADRLVALRAQLVGTIRQPELAVLISTEGEVWVRQVTSNALQRWQVIDAAGVVTRTVTIPGGIVLRAVRGSTAWGDSQNSATETDLVRLRIAPPPSH